MILIVVKSVVDLNKEFIIGPDRLINLSVTRELKLLFYHLKSDCQIFVSN